MARRRRQPEITWNRYDQAVTRLIASVGEDQVLATVGRLFAGRREVALEPISQGKSGAAVFLARAIDSRGIPEVFRAVKVAPVDDLRAESENFKKYVKGKLTMAPELDPLFLPATGTGAIAYTFVGNREDRIVSLGHICSEALRAGDCDRLLALIAQLFGPHLNTWYFNPLRLRSVHLLDAYPLGDKQLDALERLDSLEEGVDLGELVTKWRDLRSRLGLTLTRYTVVHGDLHAGNIVVNSRNDQLTLIDFGMTGEDHFLKDFVKLESDLKFRYLVPMLSGSSESVRGDFSKIERLLLSPESFRPSYREDPDVADAVDALTSTMQQMNSIILAIRKLAADRMEGDATRIVEYFIGLLRYALRMTLYDDATDNQRVCMLQSARDLLQSIRVDDFTRQPLLEPDPAYSAVAVVSSKALPATESASERNEATRKFVKYDLGSWTGYAEDQVELGVRFTGKVGSRTADIAVYSDKTKITPLMACIWVDEDEDKSNREEPEEWKWWSENTDLKCVVLYGPGAKYSGRLVYSRSSPSEPLRCIYDYDPIPSPARFEALDDPLERRGAPIVAAIVNHREFSREFIRFLVERYQHVSHLTLHSSSDLYNPQEAKEIVDALASIEDSELQLSVLWETDAASRDAPDRGMLMWKWEEENKVRGLFVPLWWRLSSEARIEYLRGHHGFEGNTAGQDYLLHEFLGLRLDPNRDFREYFEQRAENYRRTDDYAQTLGGLRYEPRPLQELWRPQELSYEIETDELPPEVIRRIAVYKKDWDRLQEARERWDEAYAESVQLEDDELEGIMLGKQGDALVITNLLGVYEPEIARVLLYQRSIDACSRALGVDSRSISTVVYVHETVHAFAHLGHDLDGNAWPDFALPQSRYLSPDFRPSRLHEPLAQYFTFKLIEKLGDKKLLRAFDEVDKRSPAEYQAWHSFEHKTLEELRQVLVRARQEPLSPA